MKRCYTFERLRLQPTTLCPAGVNANVIPISDFEVYVGQAVTALDISFYHETNPFLNSSTSFTLLLNLYASADSLHRPRIERDDHFAIEDRERFTEGARVAYSGRNYETPFGRIKARVFSLEQYALFCTDYSSFLTLAENRELLGEALRQTLTRKVA